MSSQQRVLFAYLLQAAPNAVQSAMLRHMAKDERGIANLYEKLVGPRGRIQAEANAARYDAMADEAEREAIYEGNRAARIAEILESWKEGGP